MRKPTGTEFGERQRNSSEAKRLLLEKFRATPRPSDLEMAQKRAAGEERAAQKAERMRRAKAEKTAAVQAAEAEIVKQRAVADQKSMLTDAERKAERDRRYAARKARK